MSTWNTSKPKKKLGRKKDNLIGRKFGKLTVIKDEGIRKSHAAWLCTCECGGSKIVITGQLKSGAVRSCGCLRSGRSDRGSALPKGIAIRNLIIHTYKCNAKLNSRVFELTVEQCEKLFQSNCYYCGVPPSRTRTKRNKDNSYTYNGIDRLDNILGYTIENTVSCCTLCNMKKGSMNSFDFLEWIKQIAKNKNLI